MALLEQLDREWQSIVDRRSFDTQYRQWSERHPAIAAAGNPAAAVKLLQNRRGHYETRDALFRGLVTEAQHDAAAARMVLQGLVPAMELATQAIAGQHIDDPDEVVVAVAWERIRTYPLADRPRHIAANIVLDIRKHARRHIARPSALDLPVIASNEKQSGTDELAELLGEATSSGLLDIEATRLIFRTRILDEQLADIAAEAGIPYPTLRQRRLRAERVLAEAVQS